MQQVRATRFEIGMPDDWLDQSTVTLVGPIRPGFAPNITINQDLLPEGSTLETYFSDQRQQLATLDNFKLVEHGDRLLGGQRALYHRYTWITPQRLEITQLQLMCSYAGVIYTLTASATSIDWPQFDLTFEQLVTGFRFTG